MIKEQIVRQVVGSGINLSEPFFVVIRRQRFLALARELSVNLFYWEPRLNSSVRKSDFIMEDNGIQIHVHEISGGVIRERIQQGYRKRIPLIFEK